MAYKMEIITFFNFTFYKDENLDAFFKIFYYTFTDKFFQNTSKKS